MAFQLTDEAIAGYYRDGFVIFRNIIPVSLVRDLRRECEKARALARRIGGESAQRLQPVGAHEGALDLGPFRNYGDLPELNHALHTLLSPAHRIGDLSVVGVFCEPAHASWCTKWHRDMTLESSRLPKEEFHDLMLDWNTVNQVNCALYDDDCTWFVPGSHLRMRDMASETAATQRFDPKLHGAHPGVPGDEEAVERERAITAYTKGMPGAVQFQLHAGDFALYRPIGWHIGNYRPYKRRATLHDGVFTPQYEVWWKQWIKGGSPRWKKEATAAT